MTDRWIASLNALLLLPKCDRPNVNTFFLEFPGGNANHTENTKKAPVNVGGKAFFVGKRLARIWGYLTGILFLYSWQRSLFPTVPAGKLQAPTKERCHVTVTNTMWHGIACYQLMTSYVWHVCVHAHVSVHVCWKLTCQRPQQVALMSISARIRSKPEVFS